MRRLVSRQICISEEDWERFEKLREKYGVTFSAFAKVAVTKYLNEIWKEEEK